MKRTHIAAIILIAVALGVIISTISSSSTYESFTVASQKQGKVFHVVGKLNRAKPYEYHPETNANIFSFYMFDNQGVERKVILNRAKPQDFDKSEQIVIIGKMQDSEFLASDILLKCPSKYNGEKPLAKK
ncbi:MAG: cytochrome c maturation protein CcmE [Bacteroidetes bacterium]|nr:cytochrome c maturation protein CcmE [Bacteroidota bacterium]